MLRQSQGSWSPKTRRRVQRRPKLDKLIEEAVATVEALVKEEPPLRVVSIRTQHKRMRG